MSTLYGAGNCPAVNTSSRVDGERTVSKNVAMVGVFFSHVLHFEISAQS